MTDEQERKAISYYKHTDYIVQEIANLLGIARPTLTKFYRECFVNGKLTPRRPETALKPATPKGQGKRVFKGVGKGNWNKKATKFTEEQEHEMAVDYYERGLSSKQIFEKWGANPMNLQRVRTKYRGEYGVKDNAPNKFKEKENV